MGGGDETRGRPLSRRSRCHGGHAGGGRGAALSQVALRRRGIEPAGRTAPGSPSRPRLSATLERGSCGLESDRTPPRVAKGLERRRRRTARAATVTWPASAGPGEWARWLHWRRLRHRATRSVRDVMRGQSSRKGPRAPSRRPRAPSLRPRVCAIAAAAADSGPGSRRVGLPAPVPRARPAPAIAAGALLSAPPPASESLDPHGRWAARARALRRPGARFEGRIGESAAGGSESRAQTPLHAGAAGWRRSELRAKRGGRLFPSRAVLPAAKREALCSGQWATIVRPGLPRSGREGLWSAARG